MRELRGCWSRYFLTVFFDSPTSTASTTSPLSAYSRFTLSTYGASSWQNPHHVAQNSSRTTFPLIESFVNFSPSIVLALNRGAGSLALGPAHTQTAARRNTLAKLPVQMSFFASIRGNVP